MQPLVSAMTSLRDVLVAALKSLLRGKSFLQALLAFWPTSTSPVSKASASRQSSQDFQDDDSAKPFPMSATEFLAEAEQLLVGPITAAGLKELSQKLKAQFREGLWSNPACMLPSYNCQLPTGHELGQCLALDVGGSTLRVALVELKGRSAAGHGISIIRMDSFKIDNDIRNLRGTAFFDWMADRIHQTVANDSKQGHSADHPLLMGMAWSFPIDQTSSKGGNLCGMGKGFLAADGLLGSDLGEIIKRACQQRGLHVELSAIVNDSSATLLSEAYAAPSTRFGLILGTGVNIAAHLPVATIGKDKFGERPASWHAKASHVIVNTELGMFGKGVLPLTRWDEVLRAAHPRPDFQPLEHLVSGFYLGEVCRIILIEAITTTGVFGGVVPPSLEEPYALETETLSLMEADTTPTLDIAISTFASRHPSSVLPTTADVEFLRTIASHISQRSAAIVSASLFALWELKAEAEQSLARTLSADSAAVSETQAELRMAEEKMMVAFNGSVIEHYPRYKASVEDFVNKLVAQSQVGTGSIELVEAKESSLLGAAVALACLD